MGTIQGKLRLGDEDLGCGGDGRCGGAAEWVGCVGNKCDDCCGGGGSVCMLIFMVMRLAKLTMAIIVIFTTKLMVVMVLSWIKRISGNREIMLDRIIQKYSDYENSFKCVASCCKTTNSHDCNASY